MSDLISRNDMIELTGYEHPSKQCESLDKHGIFYLKDKNGCPKTTWFNFNHPRHLRSSELQAHNDDLELDFSCMD